ncbi:MAG TPA: SRPBCC domain-containing protein [Fimbriimonadaceae bacterium]|nr:SRPBCC domain-containing protein [Fimbriimonadaceae bacterium]
MDTSKFTKRIRIKCLPEEAFARWTTTDGLESWFLSRAFFSSGEEALAGDRFELAWAEGTTDQGEVVAVQPPSLFEFTWYDGRGRVRVAFSPIDTGTLVEVTQIVASDGEQQLQEFMDCRDGWTFYLTNLKSVLEGGLDLRETQPDLTGLVNF